MPETFRVTNVPKAVDLDRRVRTRCKFHLIQYCTLQMDPNINTTPSAILTYYHLLHFGTQQRRTIYSNARRSECARSLSNSDLNRGSSISHPRTSSFPHSSSTTVDQPLPLALPRRVQAYFQASVHILKMPQSQGMLLSFSIYIKKESFVTLQMSADEVEMTIDIMSSR